jgi:hypothetical protein
METVSVVRATAREFEVAGRDGCRSYNEFLLYLRGSSCSKYTARI